MVEKIKKRLGKFDEKYPAIASQCLKYIENNSTIDEDNNVNIFHRPWVASQNWGIKLFNSVKGEWIKEFERNTDKRLPDFYTDFLIISNGGFIYDFSLYGLPPSIYKNGTLSRSKLQCLDLTSANNTWIDEFGIDRNSFHFGGRAYTYDENVGYFFLKDEILGVLKNGEVVGKWNDFNDFLISEINMAEKMMLEEKPKNNDIIISTGFYQKGNN